MKQKNRRRGSLSYQGMQAPKKRKEVEDPNNTWNMQLVAALLKHDTNTAAGLLEKGAEINHYSADASSLLLTPLHHVILHGGAHEPTLQWIAANGGGSVNLINKTGPTIFHHLVAIDNSELLEKLCAMSSRHRGTELGNALDMNAVDGNKITACSWCLLHHKSELARTLICHGCQPPFSDYVNPTMTALARACATGDTVTVDTLLGAGDAVTQLTDGQTLLHISLGNPSVVDTLLERGLSIHAVNVDGDSPLMASIKQRPTAFDQIDYLLSKGADINAGDELGLTPLMHAVLGHSPELLRRLLGNGEYRIDVNARDKMGSTALHWAITARLKSIVDMLLAAEGIDINAQDGTGATALHRAATRGKVEILSHLLLHPQLDVNVADVNGNTALHAAVLQQQTSCVTALLKRCSDDFLTSNGVGGGVAKDAKKPAAKKGGAAAAETSGGVNPKLDVDAVNADGRTALQVAITVLRDTNIAAQLLTAGASVDRLGENGGTLLHSAVWAESYEMVHTLLSSGADASLRDDDDESPLHIAARIGNTRIASLLLEHQATVDDQSSVHLRAPIHYACENGNEAFLSLLMEHRANPGLTDRLSRTPLHLVCVFSANPRSNESEASFLERRQAAVRSAMLLLDHSAPVDVSDSGGWLPLHAACAANLPEVVEKLVEAGSPLTIADDRGWTPIHCCVAYGAVEPLNVLLNSIAARGLSLDEELNRVDVHDRFPMLLAAEFGQKEVARVLIQLRK